MPEDTADRAAEPVLVVKCGGRAGLDVGAVCADLAALARAGHRTVLVHGGSADVERLAERLAVPQRRITAPDGSAGRYTDPATLEVVLLALAGAVKPRIVAALTAAGAHPVGLTGLDGGLLRARRVGVHRAHVAGRPVLVRDNQVGRLTEVRSGILRTLLDAGYVPVVSPPAAAEDGAPVNVDADRVAAALAAALGASSLVLLTGAPGVLDDPADEASVRALVAVGGPGDLGGSAGSGGIAVKLLAARAALRAGVPEVRIADGRRAGPVSAALAGAGTRVVLGAPAGARA